MSAEQLDAWLDYLCTDMHNGELAGLMNDDPMTTIDQSMQLVGVNDVHRKDHEASDELLAQLQSSRAKCEELSAELAEARKRIKELEYAKESSVTEGTGVGLITVRVSATQLLDENLRLKRTLTKCRNALIDARLNCRTILSYMPWYSEFHTHRIEFTQYLTYLRAKQGG